MRNVLVTGATRGIGLGVTKALAADGFNVLALARRETEALQVAIAEARGPGAITFLPFNLEALEDIPALLAGIREQHGSLYGLVNNAGLGTEGMLSMMPMSDIESLIRLNTLAPIVLTKHALRPMMSASQGRIVNMSSITASTGYSGVSVYAATKASMIGFTRSLAREVGTLGITVNAVAPGFVMTDMTVDMDEKHRATIKRRSALKRFPEVDDVANAVAYLMSDKARNITGTVMTVDAGNTA